jgi:hypothetical protein
MNDALEGPGPSGLDRRTGTSFGSSPASFGRAASGGAGVPESQTTSPDPRRLVSGGSGCSTVGPSLLL